MNFVTVIFFGLFIYCVVQFFKAEVTNDLIKWGVVGILCLIV